jgi:hypothetical protein
MIRARCVAHVGDRSGGYTVLVWKLERGGLEHLNVDGKIILNKSTRNRMGRELDCSSYN